MRVAMKFSVFSLCATALLASGAVAQNSNQELPAAPSAVLQQKAQEQQAAFDKLLNEFTAERDHG